MSKPSQAEQKAMIESAQKMLARAEAKTATVEELRAAHKKLDVMVDSLQKHPGEDRLVELKKYRLALSVFFQALERRNIAAPI